MNDHTITLVRESFDLIEPIAPQAGEMFLANLIEADPALARFFHGSAGEQGALAMQMIAVAVSQLDEPDRLTPALATLGRHCAAVGMRDADYDTVGAALLKTLYQCLGVAYNEEVEEAWVAVYGRVATTVKNAAAAAPVAV